LQANPLDLNRKKPRQNVNATGPKIAESGKGQWSAREKRVDAWLDFV